MKENKFSKSENDVNKSLKESNVVGINRKNRAEFKEKVEQIKSALERLTELYKEIKDV